jgi:LPS export ABC transporter permease LptF/LPS export ABC transporter permease LptG
MTRVLDRYVYRELLPPFLVGAGLFTFLHLMDRIQDFTNLAVSGAPALLVGRMWGVLVLSFLTHTLPMGVLFAVVMAAGRLASDLEVVALKASGVSPLRLFRPFLVFALAVAAVLMVLTQWINPWGYGEFFRLLGRVQQHTSVPLLQERAFTRIGDLVVYVESANLATAQLRGLLVTDDRRPEGLRIFVAPRGRLIPDAVRQRTILRLQDGALHETDPQAPGSYRLTSFSTYDTNFDPAEVQTDAAPGTDKNQTAWDIVSNTRALDWTRKIEQSEMFILDFHKRLTYPLAPVVFAMIGFPFGIRLHRGGRGTAAVAGLGLFLVYHLLQESFGSIAALRPWGAGRWLPVLVFGAVGAVSLAGTVSRLPRRPPRPAPRPSAPPAARPAAVRPRPRPRRRRQGALLVDRYLSRQFLGYLVYGLAAAAVIYIVDDLLESLGGRLRARPPLASLLEHFVYRVPLALHQALPIVVLVAAVILFIELGRHHELTAFKAAGLSLQRLAAPVLLLALALSAGSLVFQELALPALSARADEVDAVKIRGEPPRHAAAQSRAWYRRSDAEFFRIGALDPTRRFVDKLTFVEVDPEFRMVRRVDVGRAILAPDGWEFGASVLREFGPDNEVRTAAVSRPPIALPELLEVLGARPTSPSGMSFRDLRAYVRELRAGGHQVGTWPLYLHSKLSFPLMSAVLALLAIACVAWQAEGGRLLGAAIAVGIAIGYWVVNSAALSFGRADFLPPALAAWTANIVFAGIGAALLLRAPT